MNTPDGKANIAELDKAMIAYSDELSDEERNILRRYFGLRGQMAEPAQAIADSLKIDRVSVITIVSKAVNRLIAKRLDAAS